MKFDQDAHNRANAPKKSITQGKDRPKGNDMFKIFKDLYNKNKKK